MADKEKKTEEQIHYENLITFLKYAIGITGTAITIMLGIAVFIIGSNIAEVKQNLTESIEPTIKNFDATMSLLKENSQYQKELTDKRVEILKIQTENLAIEETRKRVEDAFKNNNIQLLLEQTAKKELEPRIKQLTDTKVNDITVYYKELTNFLPKAILAVDQIRSGYRMGLDTLISIFEKSQDQTIKNFAQQLIKEKSKDWYESAFNYFKDKDLKKQLDILKINSKDMDTEKNKIVSELIKIINSDQDLEQVSFAFITLSQITNKKIDTFDINAANKIAKDLD